MAGTHPGCWRVQCVFARFDQFDCLGHRGSVAATQAIWLVCHCTGACAGFLSLGRMGAESTFAPVPPLAPCVCLAVLPLLTPCAGHDMAVTPPGSFGVALWVFTLAQFCRMLSHVQGQWFSDYAPPASVRARKWMDLATVI